MSDTKPQVVIIAGPNGAGKSTLAPAVLRDTFGLLEFVNADTISAGLSAFNPEAIALDAGRCDAKKIARASGPPAELRI
jgi:predicted ABC-type ATPase